MPLWYRAWGPLRTILQEEFSFGDIKLILSLAGLDPTTLKAYQQSMRGGSSKSQLMSAVDAILSDMPEEDRYQLMVIAVDEVVSRKPEVEGRLSGTLQRLGLAIVDGQIIPLDVFDPLDLEDLPGSSAADLLKAVSRLRDGDLTGAVSAACGAVEAATSAIYAAHNEASHDSASFQEKVNVSLKLTRALERTQGELIDLGWAENEAKLVAQNLRQALNSGAYVMQQLRSRMGDVHGSKPAIAALAFESVKWAEILSRLLTEWDAS